MGAVNNNTGFVIPRLPSLVLDYLMQNLNKEVNKDDVCKAIWNNTDFFIRRNLDVQVYKIKKLLIDSEYTIESVYNKLILNKIS